MDTSVVCMSHLLLGNHHGLLRAISESLDHHVHVLPSFLPSVLVIWKNENQLWCTYCKFTADAPQ